MLVTIDKDVLRFLNGHLGGTDSTAYQRCSAFAYRDMCRTIRFAPSYTEGAVQGNKERKRIANAKLVLRDRATDLIQAQVQAWLLNVPDQDRYDEDHRHLCEQIILLYRNTTIQTDAGNSLYFGQAQKWVNMTLKNLYVYTESNDTRLSLRPLLPYMHIPLDNIIMDIAADTKRCYIDPPNRKYAVKKPSTPWSKLDFAEYARYQRELVAKIDHSYPLVWELTHWSTVEE